MGTKGTRSPSRDDYIHAGPSFTTSNTAGNGIVQNANGHIINNITTHADGDAERVKAIYEWLSPLDTSNNYNAAREASDNYNTALDKYQARTGSWFLTGSQYVSWKRHPNQPMWISGAPGCGKTTMCSLVIDDITSSRTEVVNQGIAYFFFDSRSGKVDPSSFQKMFRSLIAQLLEQAAGIPEALSKMYGRGNRHPQPSTASLTGALQSLIEGFDDTFIVIDALDECARPDWEMLLDWVQNISCWQSGKLHLFLSSRGEFDINDRLEQLEHLSRVELAQSAHNADICRYVQVKLTAMKYWKESWRNKAQVKIVEKAGGMFRWVDLQIKELKDCRSEEEVEEKLEMLPTGLEEAYQRIFARSRKSKDLKRLLQWLTFSVRPLSLSELADIIAVEFPSNGLPAYNAKQRYMKSHMVLDVCSGFVTEFDGIIKLAHMSVKDFLVYDGITGSSVVSPTINERLAHSMICQTCLVHLLQLKTLESLNWVRDSSFPLARYAAEHWITHSRASEVPCEDLQILLSRLFSSNTESFRNWIRLCDDYAPYHGRRENLQRSSASIPPPIVYAALADLLDTAQVLIDTGVDVNVSQGRPLREASHAGLEVMVKFLLERDADVNAQAEGPKRTALHAAIYQGHINIVRILLDGGADAEISDEEERTTLQAASSCGNHEIVSMLIDANADVNHRGGKGGSALHIASRGGEIGIIKLLFERGANANIPDANGSTALYTAACGGEEGAIRLLIENGAKVNTHHPYPHNSVQLVPRGRAGADQMMCLLLDAGADANGQGHKYGSALQIACRWHDLDNIQLLLEQGADVNATDEDGDTALAEAAREGRVDVVKILISPTATVTARTLSQALACANEAGQEAVTGLLVGKIQELGGSLLGGTWDLRDAEGDTTMR